MNNTTTVGGGGFQTFNGSERCGMMDAHYLHVWETMQYWCEGVLFMAFGLAGLFANALSVGILSTKDMRKHCFNQLLVVLAIFDILFIIVSVPVYSFPIFNILTSNQTFLLLYANVLYAMSPVTLNASIFMTLAITVERYLAVCKPITYRNLNTTMTSFKRMMMYVLPVCVISIAMNIPKFLETEAKSDGDSNGTKVEASAMRMDPTYMHYYTMSQIFHPTLTTGILPMAALIYMNTKIYMGIHRTVAMRNQRRRATATSSTTTAVVRHASTIDKPNNHQSNNNNNEPPSKTSQRTETNLAVVLIGIVIMHIACHTLRVFLAGMAVSLIDDTVDCIVKQGGFVPPLWSMCAESLSSLLIMVNFSGNFLIYCSVLTPFKKFLRRLCARCGATAAGGDDPERTSWYSRSRAQTAAPTQPSPPPAGERKRRKETAEENERKRRLVACPKERTRVAILSQATSGNLNGTIASSETTPPVTVIPLPLMEKVSDSNKDSVVGHLEKGVAWSVSVEDKHNGEEKPIV